MDYLQRNRQQLREWRQYTARMTAHRAAERRREYQRLQRQQKGFTPGYGPRSSSLMGAVFTFAVLPLVLVLIAVTGGGLGIVFSLLIGVPIWLICAANVDRG